MTGFGALLTALVGLSFARRARADESAASRPRTSSLSWVRMPGAEGCVATQDLARQVEARLGRPVFVSAAVADVSVEGRVEPDAAHRGFRAILTLRDAHGALLGTRELARPAASCEGMRDALALVIAVMVDPDAALSGHAPAGAVEVTAPPTPAPIVVEKPVYIEVPAASPPARPKPEWRIDLGAAATTSLGLLPVPNLGVAASSLLQPPGLFPLEGFAAAWFDDTATGATSTGTFDLAYVGGGLCPLHFSKGRVRLYGCAVGELGLFIAEAGGASSQTHAYLAAGVQGRLSVQLVGPLAARLGVDAVVPLFRPPTTDVFRPSVVGGTLDLGLGVLLP